MHNKPAKSTFFILTFLSALVIFLIDSSIELGVAGAVPYVIVIWFAWVAARDRGVWFAAIGTTLLTLLGWAMSPPGGETLKVAANRMLALFAIWVTSTLLHLLERQTRKTEAATQKFTEELENLVRERTAALERSNIELQQFAYVASHDLQTPLRAIAGFAQFLSEEYEGKLDDIADEYLRQIIVGCERMKALINDLLTYARIESRSHPFESVDLNQVLSEVEVLLSPSIQETSATITFGNLPTVQGDRSQLSQLTQNLVSNAIKYHGDHTPQVTISAAETEHGWKVSIQDNGIGIHPDHHERIFEIFKRLHTQKDYPGTGIGLAVARRIVLRHHGEMGVESEVGQGSTFWFTLPAHEEA